MISFILPTSFEANNKERLPNLSFPKYNNNHDNTYFALSSISYIYDNDNNIMIESNHWSELSVNEIFSLNLNQTILLAS